VEENPFSGNNHKERSLKKFFAGDKSGRERGTIQERIIKKKTQKKIFSFFFPFISKSLFY